MSGEVEPLQASLTVRSRPNTQEIELNLQDHIWIVQQPDLTTNLSDEETRWYLEDYADLDPTSISEGQRITRLICDYGYLLSLALRLTECSPAISSSQLLVNVVIEDNHEFAKILWETLQDTKVWPDRCRPELVVVSRILCAENHVRGTQLARSSTYGQLNIAVVSSRPCLARDVPDQLVARLVFAAAITSKRRINLHVVRPGTFDGFKNFCKTAGYGRYHLIHFDLHGVVKEERVYLLFSKLSDYGFEADEIDSAEVATLLATTGIPYAVFNACRSGWQETKEKSLIRQFLSVGVYGIVAMSHDIASSSVKTFTLSFYKELFSGSSFSFACAAARDDLFRSPSKRARAGYDVFVLDQMVPRCYVYGFQHQNSSLVEFLKRDKGFTYDDPFQHGDFGLVGLEQTILELESNLLLQSNIGILHGLAGAGKTELLKRLVMWWKMTGLIQNHVWLDATQITSFEDARTEILKKQDLDNEVEKHSGIVQFSIIERDIIVFDNFESCKALHSSGSARERIYFKKFLAELHGRNTLVVILSRLSEAWLGRLASIRADPTGQKTCFFQIVEGLNVIAGSDLFHKSAVHQRGHPELLTQEDRKYTEQIARLVDGNPMAIIILGQDFAQREQSIKSYFEQLLMGREISVPETWLDDSVANRAIRDVLRLFQNTGLDNPQYPVMSPAVFAMTWRFVRTKDFWIYVYSSRIKEWYSEISLGSNAPPDSNVIRFTRMVVLRPSFFTTEEMVVDHYIQELESEGWLGHIRCITANTPDEQYLTVHPLLTIMARTIDFGTIATQQRNALVAYRGHLAKPLPLLHEYWNPIWNEPRRQMGLDFWNIFAVLLVLLSSPKGTYFQEWLLQQICATLNLVAAGHADRLELVVPVFQQIWDRAKHRLIVLESEDDALIYEPELGKILQPPLPLDEQNLVLFRAVYLTQAQLAALQIFIQEGHRFTQSALDNCKFLIRQAAILEKYASYRSVASILLGIKHHTAMLNLRNIPDAQSRKDVKTKIINERIEFSNVGDSTIHEGQSVHDVLPEDVNGHNGLSQEYERMKKQFTAKYLARDLDGARRFVETCLDNDIRTGADSARVQASLLGLLVRVCVAQEHWFDAMVAQAKMGMILSGTLAGSQTLEEQRKYYQEYAMLCFKAGEIDAVFKLMLSKVQIANIVSKTLPTEFLGQLDDVLYIHRLARPRQFVSQAFFVMRAFRFAYQKIIPMQPNYTFGIRIKSLRTALADSDIVSVPHEQQDQAMKDQNQAVNMLETTLRWLLYQCAEGTSQTTPMADLVLDMDKASSLEKYLYGDGELTTPLEGIVQVYPLPQFRDFLIAIYNTGETFLISPDAIEKEDMFVLPESPPSLSTSVTTGSLDSTLALSASLTRLAPQQKGSGSSEPEYCSTRLLLRLSGYVSHVDDGDPMMLEVERLGEELAQKLH